MTGTAEELTKSIDELIDSFFLENEAGEEVTEKSIDIAGYSKTTADAVVNKAPKSQDDSKRSNSGRPKEIADVPSVDMDGKRSGNYDEDITSNEGKESEPSETNQSKERNQVKGGKMEKDKGGYNTPPMKKSEGEDLEENLSKSISVEEYVEFQALKKAKANAEAEELQKAEKEKQVDFVKAIVTEATSEIRKDNEDLRKCLQESNELIKSMAERPQRRKSVDNITTLEKSVRDEEKESQVFSKSEMLQVAEDLALNKSIPEFTDVHLIELENTGYIYDPAIRGILENKLQSN